MIDLILLAITSILIGIKFQVHYYIAAGIGFLIGVIFGGLSILLNVIPAVVITFGFPLTYALSSAAALDLPYMVVNSTSLVAGYLAGSIVSILFIPVKLVSKIFKTLFKLI